mmetsp:Transcript_91989/g.297595  ORF Transcript_91989/g.297595 Transcript_91989/m.297595 type:complete len:202 (+) Transcript_91989:674-1279(+)
MPAQKFFLSAHLPHDGQRQIEDEGAAPLALDAREALACERRGAVRGIGEGGLDGAEALDIHLGVDRGPLQEHPQGPLHPPDRARDGRRHALPIGTLTLETCLQVAPSSCEYPLRQSTEHSTAVLAGVVCRHGMELGLANAESQRQDALRRCSEPRPVRPRGVSGRHAHSLQVGRSGKRRCILLCSLHHSPDAVPDAEGLIV